MKRIIVTAIVLAVSVCAAQAGISWSGSLNPGNPTTWTTSTTGYIGWYSTGTLDITGGSSLEIFKGYLGYAPYTSGANGTAIFPSASALTVPEKASFFRSPTASKNIDRSSQAYSTPSTKRVCGYTPPRIRSPLHPSGTTRGKSSYSLLYLL